MSIYLKFKGISAKGFDTLHALGLTMSHKWTCDTVERVSNKCLEEVQGMMDKVPAFISYDNMQVPFRVFSQRLDNKDEFGNGTAATVYFNCGAKLLSDGTNERLHEKRALGQRDPLTKLDIMDLAGKSSPHLETFSEYYILRSLLDAPDFSLKTYGARCSPLFEPPPPIHALPCGPENRTLQYLLGTVNIPEASYEDNERLIKEWMSQLGWGSPAEQKKTGTERVVAWCGDQLTMDRLRGLFKYHAEDPNSYERLDYTVLAFGWLHCQMAFANSLYKQYLGTTQGRGLHQAFVLLEKKGLTKLQTKGPFHHDLEEALTEVAEAHFREDWLAITNAKSLSELQQYTPAELRGYAKRIARERASTEALNNMDADPTKRDEQLRQLVMWNRDVLQYIILDHAISDGDVGLMEDMLPHLFFRFQGGGNGNYAQEVLELLQGLHREWDPEVRSVRFIEFNT